MHRNKREFTPILAVIPGKTKPKNLDAYWQVVLEDFHQCGPYGVTLLSGSLHAVKCCCSSEAQLANLVRHLASLVSLRNIC